MQIEIITINCNLDFFNNIKKAEAIAKKISSLLPRLITFSIKYKTGNKR